jgi:protein subunit release factor A
LTKLNKRDARPWTKLTRPDARQAGVTTNTAQWQVSGQKKRKAKLNNAKSELNKCVAKLTKLSNAKKTTSHDAKLIKSAKPREMPSCPS